jgi:hypothetical protein
MTVLGKSIKVRKTWIINPRTHVKVSKKIYKRSRAKLELKRITKESINKK